MKTVQRSSLMTVLAVLLIGTPLACGKGSSSKKKTAPPPAKTETPISTSTHTGTDTGDGTDTDESTGTETATETSAETGMSAAVWKATLSGGQERPDPTTAPGSGTATVTVDEGWNNLRVVVATENVGVVSAAHIHVGTPGEDGPPALTLYITDGAADKTFTAADYAAPVAGLATFKDLVGAIKAGKTYLNLHTAGSPGGEIRGHIGEVKLRALMRPTLEVPASTSTAVGIATVTVAPGQDSMSVQLESFGLTNVTAAHLHLGQPGENGAPLFTLYDGTGDFGNNFVATAAAGTLTPVGTVDTFEKALAAVLAGDVYVNIHTMAHPAGAIRGQVGAAKVKALLCGMCESSPVVTSATGSATFHMNFDQTGFRVILKTTGITNPTMAHIHEGKAGSTGASLFDFFTTAAGYNATIDTKFDKSKFTAGTQITNYDDALAGLLGGAKMYVNIHTMANSGGEIRGQIGPQYVSANLTGGAVVPPSGSTATGVAKVMIPGDQASAIVDVTSTIGTVNNAGLYTGSSGTNGSLIFDLGPDAVAAGGGNWTSRFLASGFTATGGVATWADLIASMNRGNTYVVVEGQIRGQLAQP